MPVVCLILTFFLSVPAPAAVPPNIVARVNGEPVLQTELHKQWIRERGRGVPLDEDAVLENLILYRLALQEARRLGLHDKPAVREETDKIVYRAFLDHSLKNASLRRDPTDAELKGLYARWPWVRLRHLVLMARTPEEKQKSEKRLEEIAGEMAAGTSFEKLVLKYSEDPQANANGGDLDFVGHQSLAPEFYQTVVPLEIGQVSKPFFYQDGYHLFQVTDRKSFAAAPASYKQYLRDYFRTENENKYLTKLFQDLRKKAEISFPPDSEGKSE